MSAVSMPPADAGSSSRSRRHGNSTQIKLL
nr:MAG TPA: hypothetical protein [Caudoviricetes sp.]